MLGVLAQAGGGMSKARFVQAVIVRAQPKLEDAPRAIAYAETLWDILTQHGYGAPKADEPKPRATVDYYGQLDAAQRAAFGRFWTAYGYKQGRNEAAMTWLKLAEVARAEAEWIIWAAAAEGTRWRTNPPQGQTRIYAQGWLSAMRWRDQPQPPPPGTPADAAAAVSGLSIAVQRGRIINDIKALEMLHKAAPDESFIRQIAELKRRLDGLGTAP